MPSRSRSVRNAHGRTPVRYRKSGNIIGWSWNSNEYKIDLETGALENIGYGGK